MEGLGQNGGNKNCMLKSLYNWVLGFLILCFTLCLYADEKLPELNVEQMLAIISNTQLGEIPNSWSMNIQGMVQVTYRLTYVQHSGGYKTKLQDIEHLLQVLKDDKAEIYTRLCAARFLLDLDNEEARAFVLEKINGKDKRALHNAAMAVFAHVNHDPSKTWGVNVMLDLIRDDRLREFPQRGNVLRGPVTLDEIEEAGRRGIEDVGFGYDRYDDTRETFSDICLSFGHMKYKPAVPVLLDVLRRYPDSLAAIALGYIGDPKAIPALLNYLVYEDEEGHAHIWEDVAFALGELVSKEAVPILIRHISETNVIEALGKIGDKRAIIPLKEYLEKVTGHKARQIRLSLAKIESDDQVAGLLALLQKEQPSYRLPIIRELAKFNDARCVSTLLQIAETSNFGYEVRASIELLGKIGNQESLAGLVKLFGRSYIGMKEAKFPSNPEEYYLLLGNMLEAVTNQHYGTNADAWQKWLSERIPSNVK